MQRERVLIVDDEPTNQRLALEILDDYLETKTASSGEEGLALIESFSPDLILLDIMMPGIDGYEVCKRVRANPENALRKIILLSGKAMIEERLKGYDVGADDYMTKPFVPEELFAKVKVFLRLTKVEKQLAELNRSLETKVELRTRQLLDAEAKLVNSAKMVALGEMAGGLAHEINTPLGTVEMAGEQIADLITEKPIKTQVISEMTQVIANTVQRISGIVRGLRTFSRDGSKDNFEVTSLKRVVEDTLNLCLRKLEDRYIEVQNDIPSDLKIYCRPVQICQVLLNLINNSCEAVMNLPEKWIKLEAKGEDGDYITISVTDSGKGISGKIRSRIFDPFFTTKEIGKGTGLGLSISKGIIDAHHGTISVDEQCLNTRFVLRIPSSPETAGVIGEQNNKAAV